VATGPCHVMMRHDRRCGVRFSGPLNDVCKSLSMYTILLWAHVRAHNPHYTLQECFLLSTPAHHPACRHTPTTSSASAQHQRSELPSGTFSSSLPCTRCPPAAAATATQQICQPLKVAKPNCHQLCMHACHVLSTPSRLRHGCLACIHHTTHCCTT